MSSVMEAVTKRGPGRPRKTAPMVETVEAPVVAKRGPGRPRKVETPVAAAPVAAVTETPKRRPGRPKKVQVVQEPIVQKEVETTAKRGPGRPRKDATPTPPVENVIHVVPFTAEPSQVIGKVAFINGSYRGHQVTGEFDLIKDFTEGGNGDGFVTIREPNGKRTRVTVRANSLGTDYTIALNARGKEEQAKRANRRPGRPRNPNTPRRITLESTLIGR